MRNRVFFKLLAVFTLVIAACLLPLGVSVRYAWKGALLAFVVAIVISGIVAQSRVQRLQRIVQFANRVGAGDLAARIEESSADEIGQVAASLDESAHQLEASFAALQTSQRQLETLLNSMEDAVIAVSADDGER